MSIAILIFGALMAIIGIWLDYWADAKSIQKLKRKKSKYYKHLLSDYRFNIKLYSIR